MLKRSRGLIRIMAAVLCLATASAWQLASQNPPAEQQPPKTDVPVIRTRVDMVNVLFTVVDKKDRLTPGLAKENFEIYEDGKRQTIEFFSFAGQAESPPLTIVFLIDTSGSIKPILTQATEIGAEFMANVLRPNKDIAAVIQFDSQVTLVQDFTQDLERLRGAFRSVRAGGSTSLYDAVFLGIEDKLKEETGRRVLVILSDGADTSSVYTRKQVIDLAQKSDVVIYSIGIKDRFLNDADYGALKDLSKATGGEFFNPSKKASEMQEAMNSIHRAISNQYSISYRSNNPARDGSFRKIQIQVKKDGLRAKHRAGYYSAETTAGE